VKIIIFSDSHRSVEPMKTAVTLEKPDVIIHLGDIEGDASELSRAYPEILMYNVSGNCDFIPFAPRRIITDIGGVRFFMTHGHEYGVKFGYEKAVNTAMTAGAEVLLFGHTHNEVFFEAGGLTVINPGSVGNCRNPYGVMTVGDGFAYEQKYLK